MADPIKVGDTVRLTARGVDWTIIGIRPSRPDPIVLLVNQAGTRRREVLGRRLFVGGRRLHAGDWSGIEDSTYREKDNGSVILDGRQVRDPDKFVQVVTEWRWPSYRPGHLDPYDDGGHPRSVAAVVCSADASGERWLQLHLAGYLDDGGGVSLRRDQALELGHHLLAMSSYLGDGYTPYR